jgi:hypothetical protein
MRLDEVVAMPHTRLTLRDAIAPFAISYYRRSCRKNQENPKISWLKQQISAASA